MATFPELSQKQDQKFYGETIDNPAMSSKAEGGYEFTRPRFTRRPRRKFSTGFTDISSDDKQKLVDFWNVVKGGSEAFYWENPVTTEKILVRFDAGTALEISYSHFQKYVDESTNQYVVDHRWNVSSFDLKEV